MSDKNEMPYEYAVEELYINRDGRQLYGVVYIPQNAREEKMPTVIFSHGFDGSYQGSERYARILAENGYVCYRFDFSGGSTGSRSDGSTMEMSLFTEKADLESAINKIRSLAYVDSENLFLIGASQGAVVSAITGAKHSEKIRGMVLIYPAFVMVEDAKRLFGSADKIPQSYSLMGMNVGRNYFESLLDYDVYQDIVGYDKDVLLIHGDADTIAPLTYSEQALHVYAAAELKVMPGAGHGFSKIDAQQAMNWILEYLQKQKFNFINH